MKKVLLILLLGMAGRLTAVTFTSSYKPTVSSALQQNLTQPMVVVNVSNGISSTYSTPQILHQNLSQAFVYNHIQRIENMAAPVVPKVVLPSEYATIANNQMQEYNRVDENLISIGGGSSLASNSSVSRSSSTGTSKVHRVVRAANWIDLTRAGDGTFNGDDYVPNDIGGTTTPPQPPYATIDETEPLSEDRLVPISTPYLWLLLLSVVYVFYLYTKGTFAKGLNERPRQN